MQSLKMNATLWYCRVFSFYFSLCLITVAFAIFSPVFCLFDYKTGYYYLNAWSRTFIFLAKLICGLKYQVIGDHRIPKKPTIVLCKHQSTWETMFLQVILPIQTWVLKKELLRIPFFGWGLATLRPIAINRSALKTAVKKIIEQGRLRLNAGIWVILFPEGTRVQPGQTGRYAKTGVKLALETSAQILPIAHNAGVYWPKGWMPKQPGTITVVIGEPLQPPTQEGELESLHEEVKTWIEMNSQALLVQEEIQHHDAPRP